MAVRPHVVYGPERTLGLTAARLSHVELRQRKSHTPSLHRDCRVRLCGGCGPSIRSGAIATPTGAQVVDLPGEQLTTEQFLRVIEAVEPSCRGRIKVDGPAIPANVPPHPRPITELFPDWQPTTVIDGVVKTIDFYRSPFPRAADDTR